MGVGGQGVGGQGVGGCVRVKWVGYIRNGWMEDGVRDGEDGRRLGKFRDRMTG